MDVEIVIFDAIKSIENTEENSLNVNCEVREKTNEMQQ